MDFLEFYKEYNKKKLKISFKDYAKWLFEYTDKNGNWSNYDCEYENSITEDEVGRKYLLQKFMWFCMKHNFHCDTDKLYKRYSKNPFLTNVIIVKYNDMFYLIDEMNGQGIANSITLIAPKRAYKYGYVDINKMIEEGIEW